MKIYEDRGAGLDVELDCPVPLDAAEYRLLAERWLTSVTDRFADDYMDAFRGGADLPDGSKVVVAVTLVTWGEENGRRAKSRPWSERNWAWFLRQLDSMPLVAEMGFGVAEPAGIRNGKPVWSYEGEDIRIRVERPFHAQDWVRFHCSRGFTTPQLQRDRLSLEQSAAELLEEQAELVEPVFGHIADDVRSIIRTALENALGLMDDETLPVATETLRGYGWVTVVPARIAQRLGGAEALRASGAFHRVTECSNGALVLQATEHMSQYEGDRLFQVFRALAPALPPGKPSLDRNIGAARLIYEDAADYR